jgi:adenosine deaminase
VPHVVTVHHHLTTNLVKKLKVKYIWKNKVIAKINKQNNKIDTIILRGSAYDLHIQIKSKELHYTLIV